MNRRWNEAAAIVASSHKTEGEMGNHGSPAEFMNLHPNKNEKVVGSGLICEGFVELDYHWGKL